MKHFFCTILICLSFLAGLSGCQSTDRILAQPSRASLNERLPSMELVVETGALDTDEGAMPQDIEQLFEREVRMNMSDPEDTIRYGFATLQIQESNSVRTGRGLQILQLVTMMTPSLLGVPLEWYETELTARVRILDARGRELASYTGKGNSRIRVALYHGYSQVEAPRLAEVAALRQALAQIKQQINLDGSRLRGDLLAAGPVKIFPASVLKLSSASVAGQ